MNANVPRTDTIDNTIDRALSALRDAQPRSGLEGRILASLEHRTATPQPRGFHLSAHVALWTATSAAVLAIASLIVLHHQAAATGFVRSTSSNSARPQNAVILSKARSAKSKDPDNASPATNSRPVSTANFAQTINTLSSRPDLSSRHPERSASARNRRTPVFENCADHQRAGCPTLDADQQGGPTTTSTDAQLLADLHAPSHPAPPLPLTPQEKLFLRMLHYGNATQLAELDPMVRAKQDAAEAADFKAFFPDPPPLQQPTGDTE